MDLYLQYQASSEPEREEEECLRNFERLEEYFERLEAYALQKIEELAKLAGYVS